MPEESDGSDELDEEEVAEEERRQKVRREEVLRLRQDDLVVAQDRRLEAEKRGQKRKAGVQCTRCVQRGITCAWTGEGKSQSCDACRKGHLVCHVEGEPEKEKKKRQRREEPTAGPSKTPSEPPESSRIIALLEAIETRLARVESAQEGYTVLMGDVQECLVSMDRGLNVLAKAERARRLEAKKKGKGKTKATVQDLEDDAKEAKEKELKGDGEGDGGAGAEPEAVA